MTERDWKASVDRIGIIRKQYKMGWHQLAREEEDKLNSWLNERGYYLKQDKEYLFKITKI